MLRRLLDWLWPVPKKHTAPCGAKACPCEFYNHHWHCGMCAYVAYGDTAQVAMAWAERHLDRTGHYGCNR